MQKFYNKNKLFIFKMQIFCFLKNVIFHFIILIRKIFYTFADVFKKDFNETL
jgi:hypothetical protein